MSINETSSPQVPLGPDQQTVILLGPSGQDNITIPLSAVNQLWVSASSQAINYGSQIGACFIMLVVLLAMTPKARFRRAPTIMHTAALTLNLIRVVLLSLFFPSTWLELYTVMTGDVQFVARTDYNISVTATVFSIPVAILVEAGLFLQAWSMLQLWPRMYKIAATLLSVTLVITTIGFNFAVTVLQCLYILYGIDPVPKLWVRQTYLGLITASISWFCFLFISRLLIHMWRTHSILPPLKGLNAMDVLVITNGILMLVPVIFTGLQFGNFLNFESASLTLTSVIVVLPLGTLVAQRLANPGWSTGQAPSTTASRGVASKRRLLTSGTASTAVPDSPLQANRKTEVTPQISSGGASVRTSEKPRLYHADNIDAELARIDDGEGLERRVRLTHSIQHRVERIPYAVGGTDSPRGS